MSAPSRLPRRAVHGVLLLDKPVGLSSQDALWRARRLLRAEKGGHTGTLDPLASGLLPLCFGAATKFAQVSLEADKAYRATLKLGITRVGGDLEGEILRERDVRVDRLQLEAVLARHVGQIDQIPPMQSALKHQGRALYEYARSGIEVERAPRRVCIHRIDLIGWHGDEVLIDVSCSKGTYIRTLAEDIGEALGCGAHLSALRRTASGALRVEQAVSLPGLEALAEPERDALLRPVDTLLEDWPLVRLAQAEAARFLSGLRRRVALDDRAAVRVYGPEDRAFLGSAHIAGGELIADRLLSPIEVRSLLTDDATP
jgi:tRNA pseudouridine55 synthase